jgi:hypothetical protein
MAIYINEGHTPEDGGKPWKHLKGSCSRLLELEQKGYPKTRVKNVDDKKPLEAHVRRRCPVCFVEPQAIRVSGQPQWLRKARELEQSKPSGTYWVYNLYDPEKRDSQVGMAANLATRLMRRWKATIAKGFVQDGIPWLHARLATEPGYEPRLDVERHCSRSTALARERELRESLRASGWYVSSDR